MSPMMKALLCDDEKGWRVAWLMARASYWYSRGHGLSIKESIAGAWELFWERVA